MNPQEIINAFFNLDGQIEPNGAIQKSILLALEKDIAFCLEMDRYNVLPYLVNDALRIDETI
jgi:phosphosulfolactate phosphohydrolase-like enzyme